MASGQETERIIGIVGGVGPFAGLDLQQKILAETAARRDQDHLTVISYSGPAAIPDRTAFLQRTTTVNPAGPIAAQLRCLEEAGARVAGIPCNTAHAPPIFDAILAHLAAGHSRLQLLHMIDEVARFLQANAPPRPRVGLLATTGTIGAGIYPTALAPAGLTVLVPPADVQADCVHAAIYDPASGIKATGQATAAARSRLLQAVDHLRDAGAAAVILGCTEIPLALPETAVDGLPLIDPARILARALIGAAAPHRLRPPAGA